MLNLTKRVDYGLIALTHLALHPGARLSAREVAQVYGLSHPLAANVLKELARLGFVRSVRGTKGGYEAAQDIASIPVGRLVESLEGPVRLAECIAVPARGEFAFGKIPPAPSDGADSGACCVSATCPVQRGVFRLHARIRDVLYGVTIGDLLPSKANKKSESTRLPVIQQEVTTRACASHSSAPTAATTTAATDAGANGSTRSEGPV